VQFYWKKWPKERRKAILSIECSIFFHCRSRK